MGAGRVLRGAWARKDLNLGLGLVVAVATAAAVAAPTFSAAAVSDLVRERVATADPETTSLSWAVAVPDPTRDLPAVVDAAQGLGADSGGTYQRPAVSAAALVLWRETDRSTPVALAWQADLCERVAVTGRCPERPGEVLVATGRAARAHPVGDRIVVTQSSVSGGAPTSLRLTVVGTWAVSGTGAGPGNGSRWAPGGLMPTFNACDGATGGELTTSRTGALLTDLSTLEAMPDVTVLADAALTPMADVERVRAAGAYADRWEQGEPQPIGPGSCAAGVSKTDIDDVVGPVDRERSELERQGSGAAAGAVLVGVLAIVLISGVAARRRRDELALLKLRGLRGVRLAREALAEPLTLLVTGVVIGVPLGWGVAAAAGRIWLGGDVTIGLPGAVWPLVGVVAVLALLGVVAGLLRSLREPIHQQLRPVRPQAASTGSLIGRVAAFVAALVGIYQLYRADTSDPPWWALAMPAVLGFVAGLVVVWLVRRVAGLLTVVSHHRLPGNGAFLGSRRLRRGGDVLTFVPFAMAAIVLMVVAGNAWNVGSEWRESTALLRTGAPVAIASGKPVAATLDATHQADPEGRWLMTALSFPEDSGRTYRRLYADTSRWQQVLAPALSATPTDVPSDIDPGVLEHLRVKPGPDTSLIRGTRATIAATANADWYRSYEPAEVTLLLKTADDSQVTAALPVKSHGTARMEIPLPMCAKGCWPAGIYVRVQSDSAGLVEGVVTIDELRLGRTDLRDLDWRRNPSDSHLSLTRTGDTWRLRSTGGDIELTLPKPRQQRLPVLTAGGLDLDDSAQNPADPGHAFGADGEPVPVDVVANVDALPLIGDEGVFGDLSTFVASDTAVPGTAEVLVLARSDTPDDVRAKLRAAGVETGDVRPVTQTRELLDRDPYAQGLRFFWLVAALVAVIGAIAVAVALLSQRGTRGREAAALRVVGVRRRDLRASVLVEVGVLAGLVAVCGWLGAWLSSRVILSVLPVGQPQEFEPGPQTSTSLIGGLLPALVAAGVLAVAALTLLLPLSARARPAALRSGGE